MAYFFFLFSHTFPQIQRPSLYFFDSFLGDEKKKEASPTTQALSWDPEGGSAATFLLPRAPVRTPTTLSPLLFSLHVLSPVTPRALLLCHRAVKGSVCFGATC